jgi:flagellin-like hook-associated protein FlgL
LKEGTTDQYETLVSDPMISSVSNDDLKSLANEQVLVNLGMGLKTDGDTSTINSQSAFNSAIPGISFLGYGTTDVDGVTVSNNLYTLMGQIADKLESDDFSIDNIRPYLNQFSKQGQNLLGEITKSGSKSNFLSTMKTNLESMGDSLLERAEAIEYVDPGDAIMDFYMQQYTYNAALSMGTKILSKSFIDYMS